MHEHSLCSFAFSFRKNYVHRRKAGSTFESDSPPRYSCASSFALFNPDCAVILGAEQYGNPYHTAMLHSLLKLLLLQLCIQLLQKFVTLTQQGNPLNITAVYCNEQAHGFLYVESRKHAFVKEALSGMRGVYHTKLQLVPIKEMVDTVTVLKKTAAAMATGWARIKRGKYKGDIAQVRLLQEQNGISILTAVRKPEGISWS